MRLLCIIDSLGSGGAQRQMVNLATGLREKGHQVEMFIYFPEFTFLRAEVDAAEIPVNFVNGHRGLSLLVLRQICNRIQNGGYDAVISFMGTPNLLVEVAKLLVFSRVPIIVSERSSSAGDKGILQAIFLRLMHSVADAVVTNSESHAAWLRRHFWLRKKTYSIYNGYHITRGVKGCKLGDPSQIRCLIVGRVHESKNGARLIQALAMYSNKHGRSPLVAWAGRQENDAASLNCRRTLDKLLVRHPEVAQNWAWLGERNDIPILMENCDVLIHVSLYEGLPNVICEAFIAGRPVIASSVCDHPALVLEGVRGLLCDPLSPISICEAIERFSALSTEDRVSMGLRARRYAEESLTVERMVSAYEKVITAFAV